MTAITSTTPPNNPYVGPRTFSYEQRDLFFGREREARDLLARVLSERLLLFYAQSGAGKSSLLHTRLIPQLQEEKGFVVLPVARVSGELPAGVDRVDNIFAYNLMLSVVEDCDPVLLADVTVSDFLARLALRTVIDDYGRERKTWLYNAAQTPAVGGAQRYTLIIDQFEEIITAHPGRWHEREAFFRQLDAAMQTDPNLWVVLTMREDFVAALDPYAPLMADRLRGRFYMERMGKDAALDAIREPARLGGRPFAADVAEKLVDDLRQMRLPGQEGTIAGQYVEPVQLQVVCYQLWERLQMASGAVGILSSVASEVNLQPSGVQPAYLQPATPFISEADLAAAGDVNQALEQFYDDTLAAVLAEPAVQQVGVSERTLRTWFDKELITETGIRNTVYRNEAAGRTGSMPNVAGDALIRRFLLRTELRGGGAWVELVHDRFVEPIRTSNAAWFPQNLSTLERQAALWQEQGRRGGLLLQGDALAEAETWAAGREESLEPYEREFLAECRRARTIAQRERQQSRRIRFLAGVFVAVAAIAVALAVVAFVSNDKLNRAVVDLEKSRNEALEAKQEALEQKTLAETNAALANQALTDAERVFRTAQSLTLTNQSTFSSSIEDRLLLARAANNYTTTLPATTALLAALDEGYRSPDSKIAPFVPPERLDSAGGGPWTSMAFSKDGRLLALGDETSGIRLWDNGTGEPIGGRLAMPGSYQVNSLAFDPTGPRLAAVTADRDDPAATKHALILWDLNNPDAPESTVLSDDQPSMWSVAFRPDGQQLAVGKQDGTVDLWNLSGSEPISRTLPGRHADWAYSVAFDDEGKRLASAGKDGKIFLWSELSSREPISQTLVDHTAWVNDVAFSPDGARLASGSDDGTVRLWNLAQNPPTSVVIDNHSGEGIEAWDLAFSPSGGKLLAVGWNDGFVRVYGTERPDVAPWQLAGHNGEVSNVTFDPTTPRRLVSLSTEDTEPFTWNLSQSSEFASIQPLSLPVTPTIQAISADGRWLASVGEDQAVYLTDTGTTRPAVSFAAGMNITAMALSADGRQLALAGCGLDAMQATELQGTKPTTLPGKLIVSQEDCRLTVQPTTGPLISPSFTITYTQPIRAVAFDPQAADDLVVGLETGVVQTLNLSTGAAANLANGMPRLVDLAFSTDGLLLAALGKTGAVNIWNWSSKELADQSESLASVNEFSAIDFVYDDAWLAIASNVPQLELWERGTWKKVATFDLDTGSSADLVLDAAGKTLISVQPDELARWPMDPATWLELACTRAHRNLSYQVWRTAFPAEETDDSARICPDFLLDVSFADERVREAEQAITNCTPDQLAKGMIFLRDAAALNVNPPINLDPIDKALHVLSDQALEDLRQPSGSFDEHALACLQRAAEQLAESGQPAIDPAQALEVGRRLVRAEVLLADPQQADNAAAADDLEWALEHSAQWPVDLPTALSMLPQAYYRLCQQGDVEGCKRLEAVAGLMAYGQELNRSYEAGHEDPVYFRGAKGDLVTIAMQSQEFDTLLTLQGPGGVERVNDDSGASFNSELEFELPLDGVYQILPGTYGSGQGAYQLTLNGFRPRTLIVGQPVISTSQADPYWTFLGKQGQVISLDLETAVDGFDPYLVLQQADETWLAEDGDDGNGLNARIDPFFLPADGRYLVKTFRPGSVSSTDPYTLTLAALTPNELVLGQPASSTPQDDMLWTFEGRAGQIVDIAMTTSDPDFDPYLTLRGVEGSTLAEDDNNGGELNARIRGVVLPADAPYFVQVGPPDSAASYELLLTETKLATIEVGQTVNSTTQSEPLWVFEGQAGQILDIAMTTADSSFDPYLILRSEGGVILAENDDSGGTYNALIPTVVLTRTASYYIEAGRSGSDALYQLSLLSSSDQAQNLSFGSPLPVKRDGVFKFFGQPRQLVALNTDPSTNLTLVGPGGLLAEQTPAILTRLAAASPYTVVVRIPPEESSVTLHLDTVPGIVTPLSFDQPTQGGMRANGTDVWSFARTDEPGVEVTITSEVGDLDLELYAPGGARIASALKSTSLLSILPTPGDYLLAVRPGGPAVGPYTITIKPSKAVPGPQACRPNEAPDYGPISVGSVVILGAHRAVNGDASWDEKMTPYVGRQATVTGLEGVDSAGCSTVSVDVDNSTWTWRIRDMLILN